MILIYSVLLLQVTPTVEAVSSPPVDVYVRPASLKGLPKEVILYQYEVCPFCCKVKAFLDYNKVKLLGLMANGILVCGILADE